MPITENIKYIHEPTDLQCGQAVIAMLCGVTVDEVITLTGTDRETDLKQMFAAFDKYRQVNDDKRAQKMCNYIRYGTDDEKEIMLLRYGFEFEDFGWIKEIVTHVDEDEMIFSNLDNLTDEQKERVQKFI